MKKILSTIIASILLLGSISVIASCKNKGNSNNNNSKAEVVLDKVSAAAYKEISVKPQKMAAFNLSEKSTDNSENESADNSESESESPDISADIPDYTFIFKSQTTINFDIKLNNPKNYYIFDFQLSSPNKDIEYYDTNMNEWEKIDGAWIRWSGSNNVKSRYTLRLPDPSVSPDSIKIEQMYYSDRVDKTNKLSVNMNNKETYTIYKVEDDLLNCETVSNVKDKYTFKINKKDGVEITKFTVGGVDYMNTEADADGNYEMAADGKIEIEYQLNVKDNIVYTGKWERDIEVFNYDAEIDKEFESIKFKNIYGTDLPKYCLIEEVFTDNYIYIGILDHNMCYSLIKLKSIRLILVNELLMDDNGEFIIPDSAGISSVMF